MRRGEPSRLQRRIVRLTEDVIAGYRDPRPNSELRAILLGLLASELGTIYKKPISKTAKHKKPRMTLEAQHHLEVANARRKIQELSKTEMAAIIEAAALPGYSIVKALRWNSVEKTDVRDIALFFSVLHESGLSSKLSYSNALWNLKTISGFKDLLHLRQRHPEAGEVFLKMIICFMKDGIGVGGIHPEVRKTVIADPQLGYEFLDFIRDRKLQSFHDLDPESLKEMQENTVQPLRSGFL